MPHAPPVHKRKATGKRHGQAPQTNRQATRALNTGSKHWRAIRRQILLRDQYTCRSCGKYGNQVDHKDGDSHNNELENLQTLCGPCHSVKTAGETGRVRLLPTFRRKPLIPVVLVAGPPGSGKTTYVRQRARRDHMVLDVDEIKAELSGCAVHDTPDDVFAPAFAERNKRLEALSRPGRHKACWFISMAPTLNERRHWRAQLGATSFVLEVEADECLRRIAADPTRTGKERAFWERIVQQWWERYTREAEGGGEHVIRPGHAVVLG